MNPAQRLGEAYRRLAANNSARRVRRFEARRQERMGTELWERFATHADDVSARAASDKL